MARKNKNGQVAEYSRHGEILPEMKELLKKAGTRNYSIWLDGDELFGYHEREFGGEFAAKTQDKSKVVKRRNWYMDDILELNMAGETGAQVKITEVLRLD